MLRRLKLCSASAKEASFVFEGESLLSARFTIEGTELLFMFDSESALEFLKMLPAPLDALISSRGGTETASTSTTPLLPLFFFPVVVTSSALFCRKKLEMIRLCSDSLYAKRLIRLLKLPLPPLPVAEFGQLLATLLLSVSGGRGVLFERGGIVRFFAKRYRLFVVVVVPVVPVVPEKALEAGIVITAVLLLLVEVEETLCGSTESVIA